MLRNHHLKDLCLTRTEVARNSDIELTPSCISRPKVNLLLAIKIDSISDSEFQSFSQ